MVAGWLRTWLGANVSKRVVALVAAVTTMLATMLVAAPVSAHQRPRPAPELVSVAGGFTSLVPSRVLDTRSGLGAPKAAVAPGGTVALLVAGRSGVPASGVSAVVLNVTVTAPAAVGFVTVFAGGATRPTVSNLNFVAAQTVPNLVIAPVGANGKVALYNGSAGSTQLIADVSGYYRAGAPTQAGAFGSLAPSRVLDTRSGLGAPKAAVAAGATVNLQVAGQGGVPASGASAVVLNVTVTAPAAVGFVTVFAGGATRPTVSNLNFVAAQTVPNLVIAPVGANGKVALYNGSAGSTQLIADVSGYYRATSAPVPVTTVSATVTNASIALKWVNPAGSSSTGVLIRRSLGSQVPATPTSGSFVADLSTPAATYTNTGLDSGTKYTYALFAHDAGPAYAAGATVSATTDSSTTPGPVTTVTATATTGSITVKWVNPGAGSLTGVMIRRSLGSTVPSGPTSGSFVADVSKPTAAFTNTGLDPNTKYTYALFAHDAGPTYSASAVVSATTTDVDVPAITGTVTDAGGTHAGLGDVRVDVISLANGDGFSTSTLDNGTWSVTGLANGSYTVCFDASEATGGSAEEPGYVDQCYRNQPTAATAIAVTVTDGVTTTGVDAALAHRAS